MFVRFGLVEAGNLQERRSLTEKIEGSRWPFQERCNVHNNCKNRDNDKITNTGKEKRENKLLDESRTRTSCSA